MLTSTKSFVPSPSPPAELSLGFAFDPLRMAEELIPLIGAIRIAKFRWH